MANSSLNIDLTDPRTGKIAEAIANKTCKDILILLSEEEMREVDIAKRLGLAMNTTEYNLKKLIESGLVEKSKTFFWSVKGKKTPVYRVANKRIIISPKTMIKGVVPAVLISGLIAFGIKIYGDSKSVLQTASNSAGIAAPNLETALRASSDIAAASSAGFGAWLWFLLGACAAILLIVLWRIKNDS